MLTEALAHLGLMLSRLALMVQAGVMDGQFLDSVFPFDDGGIAAKVGIGGLYIVKTLGLRREAHRYRRLVFRSTCSCGGAVDRREVAGPGA